jgi:hypothetical protein
MTSNTAAITFVDAEALRLARQGTPAGEYHSDTPS